MANRTQVGRAKAMILLPAMLLGQNGHLSDAAQKLLDKPRLGDAQLTLTDGRKPKGRIVRVTDQYVVLDCDDIPLSKVVSVQWIHTFQGARIATEQVLYLSWLAPFYAFVAVKYSFQRRFPPLKPLSGSWEHDGTAESRLRFGGNVVYYETTISRKGRWSVERDRLRLTYDGGLESVIPFRFDCAELILDRPVRTFADQSKHKHAAPPIVGDWHEANSGLSIQPDGGFEERTWKVRMGTFERSETGVNMHWTDLDGPGGAEWVAQIRHRRIVVRIGGVITDFRYVPTVMWE